MALRGIRGSIGALPRTNGAGVALIGVITLVRGLFYLPALIPPDYVIPALHGVLPCWMWPTLWIGVGALALTALYVRRLRAAAFGACAGLHALWAFLYLTAWCVGASERGYVTAWSYAAIVMLCFWGMSRFPAQIRTGEERSGL